MQHVVREQGQYVWDIKELSHERVEYAFKVGSAAGCMVLCVINQDRRCPIWQQQPAFTRCSTAGSVSDNQID